MVKLGQQNAKRGDPEAKTGGKQAIGTVLTALLSARYDLSARLRFTRTVNVNVFVSGTFYLFDVTCISKGYKKKR